jgi:hypothetical protein
MRQSDVPASEVMGDLPVSGTQVSGRTPETEGDPPWMPVAWPAHQAPVKRRPQLDQPENP